MAGHRASRRTVQTFHSPWDPVVLQLPHFDHHRCDSLVGTLLRFSFQRTGCPLRGQNVRLSIDPSAKDHEPKLLNFLFSDLAFVLANKLRSTHATPEEDNRSYDRDADPPATLHPSEPKVLSKKAEGESMLCRRCSGLLVRETLIDLREETSRLCSATRCINCGHVEDSVVRANQLGSHVAKRSASRGLHRKWTSRVHTKSL
jgi:hypothetical protein